MRLFDRYRKLSVPCWCGAASGDRCVNLEGRIVNTHNTRGEMSRKQINIFLRAAGEPLLPEQCVVRSSVSEARCELPGGHDAYKPDRFHKFSQP